MPTIHHQSVRLQTCIAAAAALLMLSAASTSAQAQLVDGTFANPVVPFASVLGTNSTPMAPGKWGQEASTITGAVGPVSPNAGSTMLSMASGGGVTTQAGQAIDLIASGYGALIASGATATFSAVFNAASAGPSGGVSLSFFGNGFYSSLLSNVAFASAVNGVPADWELTQVTALIPANATWILAQVYYSNPTLSIVNGQTQAGFVDEAFLRVAAVPEPATWALMGLGALGIAWRRRAGGGQRA